VGKDTSTSKTETKAGEKREKIKGKHKEKQKTKEPVGPRNKSIKSHDKASVVQTKIEKEKQVQRHENPQQW